MSYILDALKRAEAERERGHVPGLHTQPLAGLDNSAANPPGLSRWAVAGGGGVLLLIVAALAWRMGADVHAPVPVTMAAAPQPEPSAAPPSLPAIAPAPLDPAEAGRAASLSTGGFAEGSVAMSAAVSPDRPSEVAAQVAVEAPAQALAASPIPEPIPQYTPPPPAPPRAAVAPKPRPVVKSAAAAPPLAGVPGGGVLPGAPVVVARVETTAPAAVQAADRAGAGSIPTYNTLAPSLRQQLPSLAVSGSVYSDDASARFILLNGEVAKEGSQPAPGLVLERIEQRSAVLRFQGQRFRLPY